MSFADFEAKAEQHRPEGGSAWFTSAATSRLTPRQIAAYCREHGIFLIEDCAHAHGASWNGRKPGSYGDAGVFSLYATKTISTGEGGVLVSAAARGDRARARVSQLREAFLRGAGTELPHERVHGCAGTGADRAPA